MSDEYAGQVEEAAKSHRKEKKRKKEQWEISAEEGRKAPNAGEFLSRFQAGDRLIPSITVTIFFGSEEWDGPLSLFDIIPVQLANEERFREVERRAADVIDAITNSGIKYDESEEVVDVCQAIREIRMEERKNGEQDGELKKAREAAGNFNSGPGGYVQLIP